MDVLVPGAEVFKTDMRPQDVVLIDRSSLVVFTNPSDLKIRALDRNTGIQEEGRVSSV